MRYMRQQVQREGQKSSPECEPEWRREGIRERLGEGGEVGNGSIAFSSMTTMANRGKLRRSIRRKK